MRKSPKAQRPLTPARLRKAINGLFTDGINRRATRLVLVDDTKGKDDPQYDLGGWGEAAMFVWLSKQLLD